MNTLSQAEQEAGWILMFDGKTTKGWRGYTKPTFPESGWFIEEGTLKCVHSENYRNDPNRGDIIYDTKFKDFELRFEWRIDTAGNSGVFYLAQEIPGEPIWISAPEMQILDNEGHPDAKLGINGNRKAGSLYDLIPADPQNAKPAGTWNTAEIRVCQGTIVHSMNGEKILEYAIDTPGWKKMISQSKFSKYPEFGQYKKGYIGLQDHGDNVWYRNILIKPL